MSVTDDVSNPLKSTYSREEQVWNISVIFLTLEVSKLLRSSDTSEEQPVNI